MAVHQLKKYLKWRLIVVAKAGNIDFEFKSERAGLWCLNKKGSERWMSITLASTETNEVVNTIATNDTEIIKRILSAPGEGLRIRSFQTVVTCDFPDNKGIAVADVLEFVEKRTKRGELFYLVLTKFSCYQFGGPIKLMANQVEPGSDVVIYTDEPPARRYYGG
ncbi:hypothetical protein QQF45_18320 [Halopseudomonas aestusnigri]|uniref:hypothetical protein n=1 Tax=Halopseudomonas aestusnigri TaxID=857252 RepID=UPI001A149001|nr:hypothetical protein [Halopseudomonas aestusnigri]MED5493758.1 hypothetical protein [Pseudomonadota bacterium]HIQ54041.1 hypothetical protein [Halopseudomonas pachastrellae]MCK5531179.1 hypothetical protein [Halopseudomonas aestusnigri]MDL2200999.1 hypothetical protein [Halopseudomonas aestusnigri]UGV30977.1 hypothetical protein LO767_00170 [Halopseudomonas aestusnigri]